MALTISALKTELNTDPSALGFAAAIAQGDYNRLVDLLNSVSTTHSTVTVGVVDALALQSRVDSTEYLTLTAAQRDLWNAIITTATLGIPVSNTAVRGQIATVWGPLTVTRSALVSLQVRTCTRIEALFGEGARVDANIIYVALKS